MADKAEEQHGAYSASSDRILKQTEEARPRGSLSESNDKSAVQQVKESPREKKPSNWKRVWQKSGLDATTLQLMFKGSLPPTIAIAIYQAKSVQERYGTLGYLVAIRSVFLNMTRSWMIRMLDCNCTRKM